MKLVATLIILIAFFFGTTLNAQNITGEYYGIGNVTKDGNYSQYLTELILVHKGNNVTGEFNYYFKSSHVTSKIKGVFNSNTRLLKLELIPVLNYKAASSLGADCPMQGFFLLRMAKIETTLSGAFEAIDAYKYTCPSIFIKLKKEILTPEEKNLMEIARAAQAKNNAFDSLITSKFAPDTTSTVILEEEPVRTKLKVATAGKKRTSKSSVATTKTSAKKPTESSLTITKEPQQITKTEKKIDTTQVIAKEIRPFNKVEVSPAKPLATIIKKPQVSKNTAPSIAQINSKFNKSVPAVAVLNVLKPVDSALTKDLLKRAFEESPVIEVEADSLYIALYDNGEVDGDTVAVFYNRQLLVKNQQLGTKPINLVIPIDTTVQEISMYAENLGFIPPNTAICVIMAGGKRYELLLTSTFILNGTIRFKKKTMAQIEREKKYL